MGESPGGIDKKLSGNHNQKTRFFIKPNLMQLHSSYVVTDPKGTVLVECGKLLSRGARKLGKDGKPLRNKKGKIVYEPYKDNMDTIIGNCDSSLFLGGKEETTLKSWSALLGKETIDMYNTSVTKGTQESHGQNFQKLGKDLMSMDELAVMDGGKCLLQVRGVRPFLSKKYDITQHPNYKYLSDFNPKNTFDIEKYLSTRLRVRPDDLFLNYEISPSELAEESADDTE